MEKVGEIKATVSGDRLSGRLRGDAGTGAAETDGLLCTGKLGKTFGFDGTVKFYTGNTIENIRREKFLTLKKNGECSRREVTSVRSSGDCLLVSFAGVGSSEQAAAELTGAEVFVSRENATPLKSGEVYCGDLVGLTVVRTTGEAAGKVVSWIDGPQCVLLETELYSGGRRLVPYMAQFVDDPDFGAGSIGLLRDDILD